MMRLLVMIALAAAVPMAAAQKPAAVEEARQERDAAIQRGQYRAGQAYRELQQALYESKLAEQDVINTQDAYQRARQQADELKRQLDAARKALSAAKAREAAARRRYEIAVNAVDEARRKPPAR